MIWFFFGGWICGAVFMVMYAHYWVEKHTKVIKLPKLNEENNNEQEKVP